MAAVRAAIRRQHGPIQSNTTAMDRARGFPAIRLRLHPNVATP